jgi:hypothetical protein
MTLDEAKHILTPTIQRVADLLDEPDAATLALWLCDVLDVTPLHETPVVPDAVIQYPPLELGGES